MSKNSKALLEEGKNKAEIVYVRIDSQMLKKIEGLKKRYKHKTRSNTIRAIMRWAFDNGL